MKARVKIAVESVRDALHKAVEKLPPDEYREVLEELECDIQGRTEALDEEFRES